MSGSAANGYGTADGFGWLDTGVIHPILTPFGSAATGIMDRTAGIGRQGTGADPGIDKFTSSPLAGLRLSLAFFFSKI